MRWVPGSATATTATATTTTSRAPVASAIGVVLLAAVLASAGTATAQTTPDPAPGDAADDALDAAPVRGLDALADALLGMVTPDRQEAHDAVHGAAGLTEGHADGAADRAADRAEATARGATDACGHHALDRFLRSLLDLCAGGGAGEDGDAGAGHGLDPAGTARRMVAWVCDLLASCTEDQPAAAAGGDHAGSAGPASAASDGSGAVAVRVPHVGAIPPAVAFTVASAGLLGAPLPAVRLYRRLRKRRILDHPARRQALDLVEELPGLTAAEVAEALDVSYHSARYHLEILAEFDEVMQRRVGGHVRFFPNHGRLSAEDAERAAALRDPTRAAVLDAVVRRDAPTTSEVGEAVGVATSTASFHLDRLEQLGLVRRVRDGMCVRHHVEAGAVAALPDAVLNGTGQ